jgi:hypothetical protein
MTKTSELKFYSSLSLEKKKGMRRAMLNHIDSRRKQLQILKDGILKPVEDSIDNAFNVINNSTKTISFDEFMHREQIISKHIQELFGEIKKDKNGLQRIE